MNKIKENDIAGCLLKHFIKLSNVRDTCMMYKVNNAYPAQTCVRFCFSVREGWRYQIGWIFGNIPIGLWPPSPHFRKTMLQFFYNWYGPIYTRRYEGQIVWNACTWIPEIGPILRGRGWGSTAVWNLSENPSVLVPLPVPKTSMTTRAFFKLCLVLIFLNTIVETRTNWPR